MKVRACMIILCLKYNGSNWSENNDSNLTGEMVTSLPTQREKDEEEKIYTEITKLTRSTVDRYA